ncbi:MAG: ABC transporter substrate-binding protein [Hyphomicrobiaceae bacterium]
MARLSQYALVMLVCAAALLSDMACALAEDRLRLAVTRRGSWDSAVAEIGQRTGIMGGHGLELDINYVWTSNEALKSVTSGSSDIGVGIDFSDALAAYAQGRPFRIIANQSAGAHDLYWYVRADSPLHGWGNTKGRTLAFSTDCCTRAIVDAMVREKKLKVRRVATGWPSPTLTQVLTGQIDIGWATPPFGLEHIDSGEIRVLAHGSETSFGSRTMRIIVSRPSLIANRPDVFNRFARSWRETVNAMYSNAKTVETYANWRRITPEAAMRLRDDFFPRSSLDPDRLIGVDAVVAEAVAAGKLAKPLDRARLEGLIRPLPN